MVNIRRDKRRIDAIALICEMLGITDKVLDKFIATGKIPESKNEADAKKPGRPKKEE